MKPKLQKPNGKINEADISRSVNILWGIINLAETEEHLCQTFAETDDEAYLKIADELRKLRAKYLRQIVSNRDGELWCSAKHILIAANRIREAGTKAYAMGNIDEAKTNIKDADSLIKLFWIIQGMKK